MAEKEFHLKKVRIVASDGSEHTYVGPYEGFILEERWMQVRLDEKIIATFYEPRYVTVGETLEKEEP